MQTKIITCLALATLLLTQCKKQDISPTTAEKEQSLVQQAKAFVKKQALAKAFNQLNWAKTHIFKKEGQAIYLRIPVSNQQATTCEAIYLIYDNTTFSGNYFSINKTTDGNWAIATQSLDGGRTCQATVTADGRLQHCRVYTQGNLLYELRNAPGARVGARRVQVVLVDNAGQALIWASMLGAGQQGWVDPSMSNWTNLEYLSSDPNSINDPGGSNAPYIVVDYDYLDAQLNLSPAAFDWLWDNVFEAAQLYAYLKTSTAADKINTAQAHIDRIMADADYATFVKGHTATGNQLIVWWEDDIFLSPYGTSSFGLWGINYLRQNPLINFSVFQNQFMKISEGMDGTYDAAYWNNPNLTFQQQNLPNWNTVSNAYPKHNDPLYDTPEKLYISIGGQVANLYNSNPASYQNTCALRISKALLYSGITIPPGTNRYQGADGKFYFISAAALLSWMKITFGTPTVPNHLTGTQGGPNGQNFPALLAGKKGIYIMTPNYPGGCTSGTGFCASGHADIINNGICDGGCYFDAKGGVNEIFIWLLQ
jgi:hypothetical protein